MQLEGLSKLKKIHLIGTRSRDLTACSIVDQPTTLPHTPINAIGLVNEDVICILGGNNLILNYYLDNLGLIKG
jgi:hypothetical protein